MNEIFEKQYNALTSACGYVSLESWSTIVLRGDDRLSLLQNLCTNDVQGLQSGDAREAFLADISGKVIAQLLVVAWDDRVELLSVPRQAERIVTHLDRYLIREDVQLEDASNRTGWMLLTGPDSPQKMDETEAVSCRWLEAESLLLRYEQKQTEQVQKQLASAGAMKCDESAWTTLRVESQFPLMGVDFDSSNLVQEVGRNEQAVSFRKGCYLGQETIARIDALGHVNQELVTVKFAGDAIPELETELLDGEKLVGKVTSVCWSPRCQAPLAIAKVRRGSNAVGHTLYCPVQPRSYRQKVSRALLEIPIASELSGLSTSVTTWICDGPRLTDTGRG